MSETPRTYTTLEVEAALCAWEEIDACTGADPTRDGCNRELSEFRENMGTVAARHAAMTAGVVAAAAFAMGGDRFENVSYDREFVPYVVHLLNWDPMKGEVASAPNGLERLVEDIAAEHAANPTPLIGRLPIGVPTPFSSGV